MAHRLKIVEQDEWLEPVEDVLNRRFSRYQKRLHEIGNIIDYANGYRYFGWQRDEKARGWWFREWLPAAKEVYIFGDFNGWQRKSLPLSKDSAGVWSIFLYDGDYILEKGMLYKMFVVGANGTKERIPAYATRVIQDDTTKDFTAQFYPLKNQNFRIQNLEFRIQNLYIYECHIGMAQEREGVGTYTEFAENILPRIRRLGYNAIQLMGIAEHPYYGSFGYHVSSFFAPSSRFGTPEELQALISRAHELGIAVIIDLVHAHYVKNINEGLSELDGSEAQYSPAGEAGYQPYWDSKLFDYGKSEVEHFLLSNIKYWVEEYGFDGFRFDGVTSMVYHHHGYLDVWDREAYFGEGVNDDAVLYLALANTLVHALNPEAVTIAEDVSGMPGMCVGVEEGGIGFDYRLGMAVPDFWIKMLKEIPDEDWNIWDIWNILNDRLPQVKTVAYSESHDQAMVGDKTIAFRLMDSKMYDGMASDEHSPVTDRGIALHKMIRFVTLLLGGQAYLNFMGNEFGHPEWIDFPREGNDWSYKYAQRKWSLVDNEELKYAFLNRWDEAMLALARKYDILEETYANRLSMDERNKTMVFTHAGLVFVFNWHPTASIPDYIMPVPERGRYRVLLSTDDETFGGLGRNDMSVLHDSFSRLDDEGNEQHYIKIYNTSRTAMVLKIATL